jgi:hypothetical protein
MSSKTTTPGLGNKPEKQWPKVTAAQLREPPVNRLKPGSELHTQVLGYLIQRLDVSERKMSQFYSRWQINEKKLQSYITLPDWDKRLKAMNNEGKPPRAVDVVVPYSYTVVSTIVTFLMQAFAGREPILQVSNYKTENAQAARYMEQFLQYQADRNRLVNVIWQFLQDSQIYNLGVMKVYWSRQQGYRHKFQDDPLLGGSKVRTLQTTYAGNVVENIDPFLFFPDPNVPMSKVNKEGEYVFWRQFKGLHVIKKGQADGKFQWVDYIGNMPRPEGYSYGASQRSLSAGGDGTAGGFGSETLTTSSNYVQLDECTIEIIPKELGLGPEERPEKWLFTIANRSQIIRAVPFGYDHDMHPVAVTEPYGTGYGFGHAGLLDWIGPLQDVMSWLVNSHMHNVRTAINNMFLVDPSRVEMDDLLRPSAAKIIRLKRTSFGTDVRAAVQQLQVQDVTRGHMSDLQQFFQLADSMTGVSDNMRGLQADNGRKTATEVRTATEAGASRLANLARVISAQGMVDLSTQMAVNVQQLAQAKDWTRVLGSEGQEAYALTGDAMDAGDFNFPVNDGTLPIDRVAMLDVWREIFMGISQDQQLAGQYDRGKIFEWIAELGGAKNVSQFKLNVQPDGVVAEQAAAGNIVPIGEGGGQTPGIAGNPGDRLAGGLS